MSYGPTLAEVHEAPGVSGYEEYRALLHEGLLNGYTIPYPLVHAVVRSMYPTADSFEPFVIDCLDVAAVQVKHYLSQGGDPSYGNIKPVSGVLLPRLRIPRACLNAAWTEHSICLPEDGIVDDPLLPRRVPVAQYLTFMFGDDAELVRLTTYKPWSGAATYEQSDY